jgi:hypothetical protein
MGNLLDADVEALVNTVNTVGVMGNGLALQFKRRFPSNYEVYTGGLCLQIVTGGRIWRQPIEFGGNARRSVRYRPLCPHARLDPTINSTINSRRQLPAWSRRCTEPSARARSCHAE